MVGFSDSPYRRLCRQMGSSLSVTEFVSTEQLFRSSAKAIQLFRFDESERPIIFQVFGKDPEVVLRGVSRVLHLNPDGVELNMGCSVRTVSGSGSGAGLLRTPEVARKIIRRLVSETGLPVSAKIRLGWDHDSLNYLEVTQMLEEEGVWIIGVHGRTRQMGYSGEADWERIAEIAEQRKIPVLGNGDVTSFSQAHDYLRRFGVFGVLVGRGAIGNPWIFSSRERSSLSLEARLPTICTHLRYMIDFYGDDLAAVLMRKHLTQYLRDLPEWATLKKGIYNQTSGTSLLRRLTVDFDGVLDTVDKRNFFQNV